MSIPSLFKTPLFWIAIILMVCSGASELSMAQWASAYAEAALGLSKTMGDLLGPFCLNNPIVGLLGCILCGFSVGIMWPGTLSISSKKFPAGGTAMFALLAMAGDLGGSIGPGIVGRVTQMAGDNIRTGMMVGLIFPIVLVVGLILFNTEKIMYNKNH